MHLALFSLLILQLLWLGSIGLSQHTIWDRRKFIIGLIFTLLVGDVLWLGIASIVINLLPLEVIAFIALFQLFNLYRAMKSKLKSVHLRQITLSSSFRLWLIELLFSALILGIYYYSPSFSVSLALSILTYALGLLMLVSTWRNYSFASALSGDKNLPSQELPTLSVVIPARNESESLNECLKSIIANDYPKLEILVLDDASTDKRTPEIIRSFAHDGVIFIAGKPFNDNWLAKNWAYEQLLEVANGELVLFCGADTRFEPEALKFLVSSLVSRNKQILSVMPLNELPDRLSRWYLQPLRYAWEISLPRRLLHRPPVLATCWLARREFLNNNGNFKGVSRRVSPESYFAKLSLSADGYSFFQYSGVYSQKAQSEQYETAVRLRYPQLRRQLESVMFASLVELLGVMSVVVLICVSIVKRNWIELMLNLFAYLFFSLTFGLITRLTYHKQHLSNYLLWPLFIGLDLLIMNRSMWRYELGNVLWKGRSIGPSVLSQGVLTSSSDAAPH